MKKIKEMYMYNSIVQFIVQYVLIMLLPLLISTIGAQISFRVVGDYLKTSNMNVLNHSKSMIDSHLKHIQTLSLQIARNEAVQNIAENSQDSKADFFIDAKDAIGQIENIIKFKRTDVLEDLSVYYERSHYYMVDNTIYNDRFYHKNVLQDSTSFEDWQALYNKDYSKSFYQVYNGAIQWVQPIIGEDGIPLEGVVICTLNMEYFNQLFLDEDSHSTVGLFIQDDSGDLLYTVNEGDFIPNFDVLPLDENQGYYDLGTDILIYSQSELDGWKYIMRVEEKQVMEQLNQLKLSEYLLIFLAGSIGFVLACYVSIKQGKPINDIFNVYIGNKNIGRNFKNLGSVVSQIVKDNDKLMEEMEKEKPLLRYAFLYKLIRGEFSSKQELTMLAKKVGCNVEANNYHVMAVRLFGNNDFYDMDSQTFEEVQIIFHYIQSKLRNHLKEKVWFYEVDYLTQFVILPCSENQNKPYDIIANVREDIVNRYKVNPFWGIGEDCTDPLEIWKTCEEAKAALSFATESKNLVYYSEIMTEQKGFYYPERFEEQLIKSIYSGNSSQIRTLLALSKQENFVLRKITRNKFLKLNNKFIQTIISIKKSESVLQSIDTLNDFVIQSGGKPVEVYYDKLLQALISASIDVQQIKISKRSRLTGKIKEFTHEHYLDSNLGLAMVASEFNISEGYVSTLFKEQEGINFSEYVEKLRMNQACHLLRESSVPISQIAETVGYNSIQSFRRAFKKVKGVSPSKFREASVL